MLRKAALIFAGVVLAFSAVAEDKSNNELKGYRCISNGFRQPLTWRKASQPRVFSRYRRKAMVDLKGKLKLVFPTFYLDRTKENKTIREFPFPNDVKIQAGIEPSYKMSNEDLSTSPRIVGNTVTYKKGDKETYKIITVDLGDKVIKKGEWFGVWVALENLDGEKYVPYSRSIGNTKEQIYECSYTSERTSFIEKDFIRTANKLPLNPQNRTWGIGFSPVAILSKTDYKGDVWAIIGSSIPEGWYDTSTNPYGDDNANLGYADKLISTKLGAPSVNLAKGSDRYMYCATELKGRLDILKICGVTKVHIGLGGNDLVGSTTVKTLTENCSKVVKQIKDFNPQIKVIGSTILPHSKSTDKYKTVKGQTVYPKMGGPASVRGKWNDLLRAKPNTAGLDGVHELCSYVEYDWKASTGLWTDKHGAPVTLSKDGVHPSWAGSEAIAEHAYLIETKKK